MARDEFEESISRAESSSSHSIFSEPHDEGLVSPASSVASVSSNASCSPVFPQVAEDVVAAVCRDSEELIDCEEAPASFPGCQTATESIHSESSVSEEMNLKVADDRSVEACSPTGREATPSDGEESVLSNTEDYDRLHEDLAEKLLRGVLELAMEESCSGCEPTIEDRRSEVGSSGANSSHHAVAEVTTPVNTPRLDIATKQASMYAMFGLPTEVVKSEENVASLGLQSPKRRFRDNQLLSLLTPIAASTGVAHVRQGRNTEKDTFDGSGSSALRCLRQEVHRLEEKILGLRERLKEGEVKGADDGEITEAEYLSTEEGEEAEAKRQLVKEKLWLRNARQVVQRHEKICEDLHATQRLHREETAAFITVITIVKKRRQEVRQMLLPVEGSYLGQWKSELRISLDAVSCHEIHGLDETEGTTVGGVECFRVDEYTIEDSRAFHWAFAEAAGIVPSPALVEICPSSGSGVEVAIGGEMVKLERIVFLMTSGRGIRKRKDNGRKEVADSRPPLVSSDEVMERNAETVRRRLSSLSDVGELSPSRRAAAAGDAEAFKRDASQNLQSMTFENRYLSKSQDLVRTLVNFAYSKDDEIFFYYLGSPDAAILKPHEASTDFRDPVKIDPFRRITTDLFNNGVLEFR
ncbi:hypothetical protein FOZ61_009996 [Perkinsus olseni]|uniref:Uncharacterized protein n=1 Tax=Perkinsus olseni TaxID=32597 RepID=A0A7J6KYM2_PEROL|nr:hypothetical protein FOZ61_009996 [Perkinsus olseni]